MPDSLYHLMGRALCKPQYHLENKTRGTKRGIHQTECLQGECNNCGKDFLGCKECGDKTKRVDVLVYEEVNIYIALK